MLLFNLLLSVCVTTVPSSYASLLELNDTTLLSFPPLFSLDDWAHCQNPGDQYCIVTAQLSSNGSQPLMEILQEYSQLTLKHYNRTLLHRGVCMSRCAGDANNCLRRDAAQYGLQANVTSVSWCMGSEAKPMSLSSQLLGGLVAALVLVTLVATIAHLAENKWPKLGGNKFLRAFSLKQNLAILTYDKTKPRTDKRMRDIACLEGLRVLGLQMVIFSHVFLIYVYSFVDNPQYVEKMYDKFGWQYILNSPLWLQNLFAFSGFLQMYITLVSTEKKPMRLIHCFMGIINRYIRLTPLAGFALWFTVSWYPLLGSGPQWSWLVEREAAECSERWWYHMLYVQNHVPLGKFCMGHTWYLAADFHLHIFGLFLLYTLMKFRKAIIPVLLFCYVASGATAGLVTYFYNLTPLITGQPPEQLRLLFRDSKILPMLYMPAWMNLPGFAAGMITAYLLYQDQKKGYQLKRSLVFNVFFHLSLLFVNAVLVSGVVFLRAEGGAAPRWAGALYAALDRPALAAGFNLLLLGCVTRCKSAFRDLMEWRFFHVLGRLAYAAYIVHFIVLRLLMGVNTQLNHASVASMLSLQVVVTFFTYLAAVPLCLFVELPPIQLWKAFTERTRPDEKRQKEVDADRNGNA